MFILLLQHDLKVFIWELSARSCYCCNRGWRSRSHICLLTDDRQELSIFQIWQLPATSGNRFLPLDVVKKDCHYSELMSLRLRVEFTNGEELVHANLCSGKMFCCVKVFSILSMNSSTPLMGSFHFIQKEIRRSIWTICSTMFENVIGSSPAMKLILILIGPA